MVQHRAGGGSAGQRRVVSDATGQAISIGTVQADRAGPELAADDRRGGSSRRSSRCWPASGREYSPKSATAIVMNPEHGLDPLRSRTGRAVNANDPARRRSNPANSDMAVQFNYEPGSTFKAITVAGAGALQEGLITPSTHIQHPAVSGGVQPDRSQDAESHGYETLTTAGILKVFEQHRRGRDRREAQPNPVQLLGAAGFGGRVADGMDLRAGGVVLLTLGESLGFLDVQPAVRAGRVGHADADGGRIQRDRQRRDPESAAHRAGGRRQGGGASKGRRIISATTAAELRQMLRGVLADGGTASGAAIQGYDMAGKTGTANVAVGGKYSANLFVASFVGMVPYNDRSCWRWSSSTSPRAGSTAEPSPHRRSRRSSAGRCRTSGSILGEPTRARSAWPVLAKRSLSCRQ